jgi:hydrogenase maturation protease
MMMPPTLVVGIGNVDRGDDAAGLAVVRRLRGRVGRHVSLLESAGDLTTLLDHWPRASTVVVVDAMSSGAAPGTVRRFDVRDAPLPARGFRRVSSHRFGVSETIELARALDRLPERLVVYGIEGDSFDGDCMLTPAVEAAVQRVVATVLPEVSGTPQPGL